MSEPLAQMRALLREADALEPGETQTALVEEAVRLADTYGTIREQLETREELIHAGTFGGAYDKALVAYSWCLAQYDRHPHASSLVDTYKLLWRYKWIMANIAGFPQVTRAQLDEMLADMERRYRAAGYGLRPVWSARYRVAKVCGDRELAFEAYNTMRAMSRDLLSDCAACDLDEQVTFHIWSGKHAQALSLAERLLSGGLRCATVPQRTYARVLWPLFRLGRYDDAAYYHLKGYRLITGSRDWVDEYADHMLFLALTDNLDRAVALFARHLRFALKAVNQKDKFLFLRAAWFLCARLAAKGRATLKLRLPRAFPAYERTGLYETARLAAWLEAETRAIAARFDERDGNDYYTQLVAEVATFDALVTPYPLDEH
ncbi:MAG TPA: hypothetical protein VF546_03535 [Pyrinomonadaceae bacterium]